MGGIFILFSSFLFAVSIYIAWTSWFISRNIQVSKICLCITRKAVTYAGCRSYSCLLFICVVSPCMAKHDIAIDVIVVTLYFVALPNTFVSHYNNNK